MKILLVTFFTGCSALLAQTDSADITGIILPEIKIHQKYSNTAAVYHFEDEYNLFSLANDTLFGDRTKSTYSASINDITKIEFRDGSNVGLGAVYTGAVGFVGGFIWGAIQQSNPLFSHDNSFIACLSNGFTCGVLFSLPFALVGTIIGYGWDRFEEVILPGTDPAIKRKVLKEAFNSRGYEYSKKGR